MRLFTLFALLLIACGHDDDVTACEGACQATQTKYGLAARSVHAANQETFVDDDGTQYTLVRVEYGETEECDEWGEDCGYSTYCGFIVNNEEYPVSFNFVSDADALFDESEYCDDFGCELPGEDLAIYDNEDFDNWLWDTDPEDDILISCFDD